MTASSRPFALLHIISGSLGLVASLALLLETLALAADPAATAWCDVNPFIGCSTSISSVQGSLLGVPNPVLGIVFWSGTLTVGRDDTALPGTARAGPRHRRAAFRMCTSSDGNLFDGHPLLPRSSVALRMVDEGRDDRVAGVADDREVP